MLCQICNENKATVHLTEIEKGVQKEYHICEPCAIKKGIVANNHITIKEFLGKLAGGTPDQEPADESALRCPDCGSSFRDFSASGRLGCPKDYNVFSEDLHDILEKMQGQTLQHAGKTPSQAGDQVAREKQVRQLRLELETLIHQEEYEMAAGIRDKIRELENQYES
jgi:protein arginine kinase activator